MMKYFLLFILFFQFIPKASASLEDQYNQIKQRAKQLAGEPQDLSKRIKILLRIYDDSRGKHTFPLVAAHGAKWGIKFFKASDPLIFLVSSVHQFDFERRLRFIQELKALEIKFQKTNRAVFVDTYTNYYFSKYFGTQAGAEKYINPRLLNALNNMHSSNKFLENEKSQLFKMALYYEQEVTVSPRIEEAKLNFQEKWIFPLIMKPIVQFSYFPDHIYFFFNDFSNKQERINYALRAHKIGSNVGWDYVRQTIQ